MYFTKWQGLGNDFVIVNGSEVEVEDCSQAAIEICDRHFGIGADGLIFALPSTKADFRMKIMNSDGSEAEMCGNGIRCLAKYVYNNGLTKKKNISFETLAGIIKPQLLDDGFVRVDMGEPHLLRSEIPMAGNPAERAVAVPIKAAGETFQMTAVSMGNPHCIIFVDDISKINLSYIGPQLETHEAFPRKINIEFVEVHNDHEVRMRVWERGAGITLACGTGSCAVLAASVLNGHTGRKARICLDGGDLYNEWGEDNHIYMSGPAIETFSGKWHSKHIR